MDETSIEGLGPSFDRHGATEEVVEGILVFLVVPASVRLHEVIQGIGPAPNSSQETMNCSELCGVHREGVRILNAE